MRFALTEREYKKRNIVCDEIFPVVSTETSKAQSC